ncbi:MAG: hypothetical protein LRZ84_01080 [Desertifilum sp.]|nr:hypothetical protein [Desertifilum sp.]
MKYLILALIWILTIGIAPPAEAALCRTIAEHQICLISVKRSAKYFWEYRAIVQIDGKTRPLEVYNCRDRTRIREDGIAVPFEPSDAGGLICNVLK